MQELLSPALVFCRQSMAIHTLFSDEIQIKLVSVLIKKMDRSGYLCPSSCKAAGGPGARLGPGAILWPCMARMIEGLSMAS